MGVRRASMPMEGMKQNGCHDNMLCGNGGITVCHDRWPREMALKWRHKSVEIGVAETTGWELCWLSGVSAIVPGVTGKHHLHLVDTTRCRL